MHGANAGSVRALAERSAGHRWTDLKLRAASAAVLGALALAGVWQGGALWSAVVLLGAIALAAEWALLTRHAWQGRVLSVPVRVIAGLAYLLPGCLALLWLRFYGVAGLLNTAFLLTVVWASDIGAYGAGRLFGGPRLAPRISPGKTWSGGVGGLCAAVLAGACFGPFPGALLVAALLGVVSQAGDLWESAIKRKFGVKDSGRIIPGHGGVLDRVDGLLAAAPVAAGLAAAMGPGMPVWG